MLYMKFKFVVIFWKVRQPTEGEIKEKLFIVGKKIKKWLFIRVFFTQFENCVKLFF
jgi:hypothetical protein